MMHLVLCVLERGPESGLGRQHYGSFLPQPMHVRQNELLSIIADAEIYYIASYSIEHFKKTFYMGLH